MSLIVGDSNKAFRVSAGYDLSSYTELSIVFTLPDSTTVTKTTADGVIIGTGTTDADLGVLAANFYVEYPIEVGFLSQAGTWYAYLVYTDTVTTPDTVLNGACASFTVSSATCG